MDFYPDEWLSGAGGLNNAERGLYITACALIYSAGGPISASDLRSMCVDHGHAFRHQLGVLLKRGKLIENDGQIINKRCLNELQKAGERVTNARQNGLKGGRPPKDNNSLAKPAGSVTEKLTTNYQLPTTKEKKDKPDLRSDFAAWYAAYPRKIAPGRAEKAYAKARNLTSADELLDGIERYRRGKASYADWRHPATWLNDKGWLDDYGDAEPSGDDGPKGPPPTPDGWPELKLVAGGAM